MDRRAVAVVLALVVAALPLTLPASAQDEEAAVEGSGDFVGAPPLAQGRYTDTIQLGEKLFYAVPLTEGQRLSATVSVLSQPDVLRQSSRLSVEFHDPRRRDVAEGSAFFDEDTDALVSLESGVVGSGEYVESGTYYVSLTLLTLPGINSEGFGFTTTIDLVVTQDRLPASTTSTTIRSDDNRETELGAPPGGTSTGSADRVAPMLVLLAVGLASFVAGGVGGALVVGRGTSS